MSDIPPITTQWAEHASPETIRADRAEARRMRNRWNRRVVRLTELLDQRTAAAGPWPATSDDTNGATQ